MAISEEFISELRDKTDIEEIIAPYVSLKRRGRTMIGLCPFHNEKTPSFTVYPDSRSFFCFGCGAGGDSITFVRRIENLDYVEAIKSLADRYGLHMPEDGYDDTLSKKRTRILAANREAAKFFHSKLFSERGRVALDYLLNRGLTMQTIKHFGMGYAPDSWDSLISYMQDKGFSQIELVEANLAKRSTRENSNSVYDNFRNRVMTPIIDVRGNVIAFGGRVLDDSKPKYINTSDTLVYKKSNGVFGLNFAKNSLQSGKIILAEGYMDVITLHQAGFENSVAGLGTALTREQARLISRYADEIVLSYDSDEAGQEATKKAIAIFSEIGVKLRVLKLTGGKDPDEIIKKHGKERFQSLIDGAANDIEYKILAEREKYDVSTDDGKLSFLRGAIKILAAFDSGLESEIYASRLSEELSVGKEAILLQIKSERARNKKHREKERMQSLSKISLATDKTNPEKNNCLRAATAEEKLISILINNPDFYKKIKDKILPADFITELNRRIYSVISSRLEDDRSVELEFISGSFSADEISYIKKLAMNGQRVSSSVEECEGCIKVLAEEKLKDTEVDPSSLSDEDFLELIAKKKNAQKQ